MDKVFIVYPEERWVPFAQIETWYSDALANGKIAPEYAKETTRRGVINALMDAGIITEGKSQSPDPEDDMEFTITINLADDEIEQEIKAVTIQKAFDRIVSEYPRWQSMVIVVCNPALRD